MPRAARAPAPLFALVCATACGANGDAADGDSAGMSASASDTEGMTASASGASATADGADTVADATVDGGSEATDSETDTDTDTDTDTTGGEGPETCPGSNLALLLRTGDLAPGIAEGTIEGIGPSPQKHGSRLAFTVFLSTGQEVLYVWDDGAPAPVPIVVTGQVLPGTNIGPQAFNGLPVVAEDGSVAYQVVEFGTTYVFRYDDGGHTQILSEGSDDSPNGLPILALQPFSNFSRGAAYFDGTLAMWVQAEDDAGANVYGVLSRVDDAPPTYHLGSGDVVGLPPGHAWEAQDARLHLSTYGLFDQSLVIWARVGGQMYDRGLLAVPGGPLPELGPLSSGWRQVGLRPSNGAYGYYFFDGDEGVFVEDGTSFPIKGEPVPGRAGTMFSDLYAFALADGGGMVFTADAVDPGGTRTPGLFTRNAAGTFLTIALEGDDAPDVAATLGGFHSVQVSRTGDIAVRAFLDGLPDPQAVGLFFSTSGTFVKGVAALDVVDLGSDCASYTVVDESNLHHGVPTDDTEIIPYAGGRQVAFDGVSMPIQLELEDDAGATFEALVIAYVP